MKIALTFVAERVVAREKSDQEVTIQKTLSLESVHHVRMTMLSNPNEFVAQPGWKRKSNVAVMDVMQVVGVLLLRKLNSLLAVNLLIG